MCFDLASYKSWNKGRKVPALPAPALQTRLANHGEGELFLAVQLFFDVSKNRGISWREQVVFLESFPVRTQ